MSAISCYHRRDGTTELVKEYLHKPDDSKGMGPKAEEPCLRAHCRADRFMRPWRVLAAADDKAGELPVPSIERGGGNVQYAGRWMRR